MISSHDFLWKCVFLLILLSIEHDSLILFLMPSMRMLSLKRKLYVFLYSMLTNIHGLNADNLCYAKNVLWLLMMKSKVFKRMIQTNMPCTLVVIAQLREYVFVVLQVVKGFPVLKDERRYSRSPRDSQYLRIKRK